VSQVGGTWPSIVEQPMANLGSPKALRRWGSVLEAEAQRRGKEEGRQEPDA